MAQRMPEFYRKFLDDNYKLHRDYNRSNNILNYLHINFIFLSLSAI